MADFFDYITDKLKAFIEEQPVFFVATAAPGSRINLSPKGMDSFRVLSPKRVAYLDLTGSGNETAAHLKHDGRITVMFNSFSRNALILRLYGRGHIARPGSAEFEADIGRFPTFPGIRQIIFIDVDSAQTSCGYGVPEMALQRQRAAMAKWAESKGVEGVQAYWGEKNVVSIDGLETGIFATAVEKSTDNPDETGAGS